MGQGCTTCAIGKAHSLQVVHGVLTEDSDAFLYGATVVYKDLSTDQKVHAK